MKQNNILNFGKLILLFAVLLSHSLVQAQTPIQRRAITRDYDHSKLQAMAQEFAATAYANKQEALALAKIHGWEPIKYNEDGTFDELMGVRDDGSPIYYTLYNEDAARSTRTNHLNTGGSLGLDLNGQGMKVHVWDGGPTRPTHQEFYDQVNPGRVFINDGVTTLNGVSWHAQHVTGTIIAAGVQPKAKGMAPLAQAFTHDWHFDRSEAAIAAARDGMLLSNHSYGWDNEKLPSPFFGAYEGTASSWDELMYEAPAYLPVFAAGNDGLLDYNDAPLNGNQNFDKLSGFQTAKNNLVVANAQDAEVAPDGSLINVSINPGSSQGPTDDFRIKPDITGNGTGVYSTHIHSIHIPNDVSYRNASGTSMAAPNVTGSLLLLQEHYHNLNGLFMRAATLKGLALHTADDAGTPGPDAIFGWGLLNAKAAAQEITDNGRTSIISELTLTPGQSYSLPVEADGVNDLIASISWTDPPGTVFESNTLLNNSTPKLVNDLDIRVTQASSTFFPYRLTGVDTNDQGDNIVDPYERVDVKGASGSYIVTVTHKGPLSGGFQNYSLIVTGVSIGCDVTPTNFNLGAVGRNTSTISWNTIPDATYDIRYRKSESANWATVSSSNASFFELNGLESGTQYEVQVRSKCQDNNISAYSASVFFTTKENSSFITVWQTTMPNEKITIPTNSSSGQYNYTVDWGDGTFADRNLSEDAIHTYTAARAYEVKITGDFPHIHFNDREGSDKIQAVRQWGDIQWKSMKEAFAGCSNLEITATDAPDLSAVTDMSRMFQNATSFNQDISNWDVSKVIDMHGMFHGATAFNQDISNWNVSNVEIMRNMFWKATSFNQDIGSWDVSNVTSITWMFEEATAFNQDIGDWNVSSSISMLGMFKDATSFNQDISRWDMSNVESTTSMFHGATSFNQDIGSWDVSNVTYMTGMFKEATSFNQDLGDWTSHAINRHDMFVGSGLDCTNYSLTLFGWANNTSTSHVQLGADGMEYGTDVSDVINELITNRNWIINNHKRSGGKCLPFVTGMVTPSNAGNVQVYPNPVKEQLNIVLNSNHEKIRQMVIRTVSGQVLRRMTVSQGDLADEGALSVDISNLESGLYLLEVQGIGISPIFRTKFFKQ